MTDNQIRDELLALFDSIDLEECLLSMIKEWYAYQRYCDDFDVLVDKDHVYIGWSGEPV